METAAIQRDPGVYTVAKRLTDLGLALVALVVTFPIALLVAIAIRLNSPGPVFYLQTRIGQGGRPFTMVKFRTMIVGNDPSIHESYYRDLVNGTAEARKSGHGDELFLLDDPRVTAVGRWLRRTSLDELPNLINVIHGRMTLVGPRPPIPYEVEMYDERARQRLLVKPGMTGLAQVNGRGSLSFERIIELDLDYIESASYWLDIQLLIKTIPAVLQRKGI